jgi:hypothetical protein
MGARSMEKKRKQLILDEMKIREELANNQ